MANYNHSVSSWKFNRIILIEIGLKNFTHNTKKTGKKNKWTYFILNIKSYLILRMINGFKKNIIQTKENFYNKKKINILKKIFKFFVKIYVKGSLIL